MSVVHSSILVGCLVVIAVCAIVFPILFIVSFHRFRKEVVKELKEIKKDEV